MEGSLLLAHTAGGRSPLGALLIAGLIVGLLLLYRWKVLGRGMGPSGEHRGQEAGAERDRQDGDGEAGRPPPA